MTRWARVAKALADIDETAALVQRSGTARQPLMSYGMETWLHCMMLPMTGSRRRPRDPRFHPATHPGCEADIEAVVVAPSFQQAHRCITHALTRIIDREAAVGILTMEQVRTMHARRWCMDNYVPAQVIVVGITQEEAQAAVDALLSIGIQVPMALALVQSAIPPPSDIPFAVPMHEDAQGAGARAFALVDPQVYHETMGDGRQPGLPQSPWVVWIMLAPILWLALSLLWRWHHGNRPSQLVITCILAMHILVFDVSFAVALSKMAAESDDYMKALYMARVQRAHPELRPLAPGLA